MKIDIGFALIISATIISVPFNLSLFGIYRLYKKLKKQSHKVAGLIILYKLMSEDGKQKKYIDKKMDINETLASLDEDNIPYREQLKKESDEEYEEYIDEIRNIENNTLFIKTIIMGIFGVFLQDRFPESRVEKMSHIIHALSETLEKNMSAKNCLLLNIVKTLLIQPQTIH